MTFPLEDIIWQFQNDWCEFENMSTKYTRLYERHFRMNEPSFTYVDDFEFMVHFPCMMTRNTDTNETRKIRRLVVFHSALRRAAGDQ